MSLLRRIEFYVFATALVLGTVSVRAADRGTYAGVGTLSPCPSFCGGSGSHSDSSQDGGPAQSSAATSLTALEGFGSATATLNDSSWLPVLGVYADANPNAAVNSQAIGYQAFKYVGTEPTSIDLELMLEGAATAVAPATASARASVAVILGDDLPFSTHYPTLVFEIVPGDPNLELLGKTELFLPANVGETTIFGSIPVELEPGDKFYVWAGLLATTVRNGLVDADNTFTAAFSDATNIVPVPEPRTASLLGIGTIGVILIASRQRSTI